MSYQSGITFQNFKSFKDKVSFDFSPFTILTGGNSSGKSTVFQALSFFNTFIADTIKKNFSNYGKNEKDSLLSSLFVEVDSNKFINQNKIFSNLLNRESDSNNLYFEIPLVLDSYSNKVTAKFEFDLNIKISHTCQLKKFKIYDDVLNIPLVEYHIDGREVKMKTNFKVFYKDIILRAEKLNLLVDCIKKISLEQGVENISERMNEIVKSINNDEEFMTLSYNLFGHVVKLSTMVHYTQKIIVKDHLDRFDPAGDLFIEFDKNNIYLFVFQTSMLAMNNMFDNFKKYISKSINVLDGFISSDTFDVLKTEFYKDNNKYLLDLKILENC
jgi:AAA15 family ATPase/GTPase